MRVFADHVPAVPSLVNFASLLVPQVAPQCPTPLEMRLFIAVVPFQNHYGLLCRPLGAAVPKMGKLLGGLSLASLLAVLGDYAATFIDGWARTARSSRFE